MRSFKIWKTVLGTAALLAVLNLLLIYLLEPAAGSSSDTMWQDYQGQEELDTIFVGSSLVSRSLDPAQYDAAMGTHSCNMGTNAQMFAQSYTAIQTAWREHRIQTVILGIGYFEFQYSQGIGNEVAFYRARNRYSTVGERLQNDLRYVLSGDNFDSSVSLNYFFPWVYDHVTVSAADIRTNVQEKLAKTQEKGNVTPGNGFSNGSLECLDFNTLTYDETSAAQFQKETSSSYKELAKICDFCREKGIRLYVINMPLPEYYVVAFPEQYFERADQIRETCEEHGFAYYDFNVSRPSLFQRKDSYYQDYEHMNQEGAEAFTVAVAGLVRRTEQGEDVTGLFYGKEEYLRSVDRIVCTNYTWERQEAGLSLQAYAYCGSLVKSLFRFSVWDETSGSYKELRPFEEGSVLQLSAQEEQSLRKLSSSGVLRIRVEAKDANGEKDAAGAGQIRMYEEEIP